MFTKDVAAELFEIRVRGALAMMLDLRKLEPTSEEWEMIRGQRDVTMRDIGEISHRANFNVLVVTEVRREDE